MGGTAAGAGNLISGNSSHGVELDDPGTSGNVGARQLIGTDIKGTAKLGNAVGRRHLLRRLPATRSGGTAAGAGNIVSGNVGDHGVVISDAGTSGNGCWATRIGTDANGTRRSANDDNGVDIDDGASANTIGGTAVGARK